jgi:hypothetical protein
MSTYRDFKVGVVELHLLLMNSAHRNWMRVRTHSSATTLDLRDVVPLHDLRGMNERGTLAAERHPALFAVHGGISVFALRARLNSLFSCCCSCSLHVKFEPCDTFLAELGDGMTGTAFDLITISMVAGAACCRCTRVTHRGVPKLVYCGDKLIL